MERLKAALTRAQIAIMTTIEQVLDLDREALFSRDDLQQRLTVKKGEPAKNAEAREKLQTKLLDAKLKL